MGSEFGLTADSKPQLNMDSVGIWWICWACLWTGFVGCGMTYLIIKRHAPILRVRGLALSLFAIGVLHVYWVSIQIGYVVGPLMPGDTEYWIMGTYFPFGVALFHASNSQFLHVARTQKQFTVVGYEKKPMPQGRDLVARFKRLAYSHKMLVVVGVAILFQLLVTVLMYLISRKWHSSWGIPGTEVTGTAAEKLVELGRGWEWWPTCFFQLFWAWVVAPVTLWKARNVHDTQGWRLQTIGCAIAGLPSSPMWIIALYVPAMEKINKYWVPPQWTAACIWFIEIFTIFIPCWQVLRHGTLLQETLDSIKGWETQTRQQGSSIISLVSGSTAVNSVLSGKKSTTGSVASSSNESILTMSALEYILERNPTPLLRFSSLRDFSGENIAFLTNVRQWKDSLPATATNGADISQDAQARGLIYERFNRALRIYAQFVSPLDADFPINISSSDLKKLQAVFESAARMVYGDKRDVDSAASFDPPAWIDPTDKGSATETYLPIYHTYMVNRVEYWGEIPVTFNEKVFDDAVASIKYLVLTNTWPKFIKDRRASMDSEDTIEVVHEVI